jgi:hypothetical protein
MSLHILRHISHRVFHTSSCSSPSVRAKTRDPPKRLSNADVAIECIRANLGGGEIQERSHSRCENRRPACDVPPQAYSRYIRDTFVLFIVFFHVGVFRRRLQHQVEILSTVCHHMRGNT